MSLTMRVDRPLSNTSRSQHACSCKFLSIVFSSLVISMGSACDSEWIDSLCACSYQCLCYFAYHVTRVKDIIDKKQGTPSNQLGRTHSKSSLDVICLLPPIL